VAPRRHRFGLYFDLHARNITGTEVITFLRQLLRHLRGPVVLLWDGGKIHRRHDVQCVLRRHPRLEVHRFPGYAPELNPDELVWNYMKRTGTARRPLAKGQSLQDNIEADMPQIQRNPGLVKSFFRAPYVAYITD